MRARVALTVILLVLVLSQCTIYPDKPVKGWKAATGGEQFERLLWQDIQHKNWSDVEDRLSATFVFITPNGRMDRAGTLEYLQKLDLGNYSLGEFDVQPSGSDFIVTYTFTRPGRPAVRMMTVWQQAKRNWVAIAHSGAPDQ